MYSPVIIGRWENATEPRTMIGGRAATRRRLAGGWSLCSYPSPLCPNRCFCPVLTANWRIEMGRHPEKQNRAAVPAKRLHDGSSAGAGPIANEGSIVLSELL